MPRNSERALESAFLPDCESSKVPKRGLVPTGATKTAFDAAVPDNTALVNQIMVTDYVEGKVLVRLKGGSFVTFNTSGNNVFGGTLTSGSSTASNSSGIFDLDGFECDLNLTDWSIKPS